VVEALDALAHAVNVREPTHDEEARDRRVRKPTTRGLSKLDL
jgi:hypothetical protein